MEKFLLSWPELLLTAFVLIGIYLLLRVLISTLKRFQSVGLRGKRIIHSIQSFFVVYEPLSAIILTSVFILVNPVVHGLLVAFLALLTFPLLRNYFNGRVLLLVSDIEEGLRIKGDEATGVVQNMGRLGLDLQTREGNQFVNYTTLLAEGYIILKGDRTGGFHQLILKKVTEKELPTVSHQVNEITHKFFNCPYLDWSYKPEIEPVNEEPGAFSVRVLVKKDPHLDELVELVGEWGYACSVQS